MRILRAELAARHSALVQEMRRHARVGKAPNTPHDDEDVRKTPHGTKEIPRQACSSVPTASTSIPTAMGGSPTAKDRTARIRGEMARATKSSVQPGWQGLDDAWQGLHRREGVEEVRQERGAIAEGTGNHIVTPISVRRRWLGTNRVRDQPAGARLQKGRPLTHR